MATRKPIGSVTGGIESGRLGGYVRLGSAAFHRKQFTSSARSSLDDINRRYSEIVNMLKGATPEIMQQVLQPVLDKSLVYCPVDKGPLRASGRITVESSGSRTRSAILYGGPSTRYAAIVHERTDLNHKAPTSAKFLQRAMEEEFSGFLAHLAVLYAKVV